MGLILTQLGILLVTFFKTGFCLRCQVCQYYKLRPSLNSMVTHLQDYTNMDCIQKAKMNNFSTDCIDTSNHACLKMNGNFKLHGSNEWCEVEFVIRGCSYTAESKDCSIFPNASDGLPSTVQQLVNSIESTSIYHATAFDGRQCLCAVDNCNAGERQTDVISSMILVTVLATFTSDLLL